jgi:heme oxygenase
MERLRTETSSLHSDAETRKLQREIAKGLVEREQFVAYLGQLYRIHRVLEDGLARSRRLHPAVEKVATPDRMRVPDLVLDLEYYGVKVEDIGTGSETKRFIDLIEATRREDPSALLGALYVLEGSTNGGKYLAHVLRKAWALEDGGLCYLDPYGDRQAEQWARFKIEMNAHEFGDGEEEAIVEMAKTTFEAISAVSDEVAGVA